MYELPDYLAMVDDPRRTSAYLAALRATIRPADRVLEIGTGFGFFAVAAARCGAAHVWAVEPNDAIDLGPRLAAHHGVADRITFVQAPLDHVTLPQPATVLLEDLRGVLPVSGGRLAILRDAHTRLLTPDARCIAERDHLMVAPCAERADAIAPSPHPIDGIAVDEIRARAASATSRVRARDLRPLAPARRWTTIELARPDERAVHGTARCEVETTGTCAGLGVWFEAELAGGARFTSGPSTGTTVYDCAWFPLPRPLDVVAGDRLEIRLRAVSDGQEFVWRWEVVREPASGGPAVSVQGTDLAARMIGASRRARRAAAHVPARDAAVEEVATLASLVDGVRSLAGIAEVLQRRFPARWPTEAEALAWASRELARLVEGGA